MNQISHTGESVVLSTEAEMMHFGETIAQSLPVQWLLALQGELGSGKTTFVKGLARGLGCEDLVSSPTFNIIHQYDGKLPLVHCDWYRLERATELDALGWDEVVDLHPRIVVEWGEKFPQRLPKSARHLNFSFQTGGRVVTFGAGW